MSYLEAAKALNNAAYAALRAAKDTTELPNVDRQTLRLIAGETDRLVDQGERSGLSESRIQASDA